MKQPLHHSQFSNEEMMLLALIECYKQKPRISKKQIFRLASMGSGLHTSFFIWSASKQDYGFWRDYHRSGRHWLNDVPEKAE